MIHANPKTYVVEVAAGASEGYTKEPVIGWEYQSPKAPEPITIQGRHVLVAGCAILHPCGMVTDPHKATFDDIQEWLSSSPQKAKAADAEPVKRAAVQTDEPEIESTQDEGAYDIDWTTGTYKTNSFWHYDDGEYEFVYQVDAGLEVPKATSKNTKIKRTDMMDLKKSIDLLDLDDVKGADPLPAPEVDEDEDDGEDLI